MHLFNIHKTIHICTFATILSSLFNPTLSIDHKFMACEQKSCENGPIITYPFWLSHQQDSNCGHPNFKVTCKANNPTLTISNDYYVVKQIFYSNHSLLVANSHVYNDKCPVPQRNVTLKGTPFNFISNHVNISFFNNCSAIPSNEIFRFPVNCSVNESRHSFATFHAAMLVHVNYSLDLCESVVSVPADTAYDIEFDSLLGMDYIEILKMGFLLNWTVESGCTSCRTSGGRCGFSDHEFVCFCGDGTHENTCHDGRNKTVKIIIGVGAGIGGITLMCLVFLFCYCRKTKRYASILSRNISSETSSVKDLEKTASMHYGVRVFTYEELAEATNNFDASRELGDGGFGTVYKGMLKDGRDVAVKRLYENNYKRVEQFKNEIEILAHVRHLNLVSLYGCTSRHCRELLLVYEFIPNGTVADHLHGPKKTSSKPSFLPWPIRLNIAVETASALAYLHRTDIVHRDVKTNNILLDNNFTVKVADFGLSRLFPDHVTHVSTAPQGTPGYVDPDYHQCYQLTSKSDVFSFGVVLMELVTSLPAVDITRHRHDINLSTMAINRIQNHILHEIVDADLGFESDPKVKKMITSVGELAFQCLQNDKDLRPDMDYVWEELKAIQSRDYDYDHDQNKVDKFVTSSADDAVLLKNGMSLMHSPESGTISWTSSSRNTTPNASN